MSKTEGCLLEVALPSCKCIKVEEQFSSKKKKIEVYYANVLQISTFGLLLFVTMRNLLICTNIVGHSVLQCTTVCCCVYSSEPSEDAFKMLEER